jgi:hypothetical protein
MSVTLLPSTSTQQQEPDQIRFGALVGILDNNTPADLQLDKRWRGVRQTLWQTEEQTERWINRLAEWARVHRDGATAEVQAWVAGAAAMLERRLKLLGQISDLCDQLVESDGEQCTRQQVVGLYIGLAEQQTE